MGNDQSSDGYHNAVLLQQDEGLWRIERVDEDPPVCLFTSIKEFDKCKEGLKVLRVLRHPNVLKFLSSDPACVSPGTLSFYTELVFPLQGAVASQQLEGVVRGWRDVGCGLDFLHNKASLSHNNLHVGCVYVGGADSKWKIGGFELTKPLKKCTKQFFMSVSLIRHRDAIPPEDEDEEEGDPPPGVRGVVAGTDIPIHARDTWAFGNLMLQTIEDIGDEEDVSDDMVYYINNEMLNQSPELRPSIKAVMQQPFMKNTTTNIIDFLTNLTMKSQSMKNGFFKSLASKLHSLPPIIVAEHIVPLLLTPLVMAEPLASQHLWEHLLCPVSSTHRRNNVFDPNNINPLLDEKQFKSHILPLLLNLLESREYHIRMILLHNLHYFCYLCSQDDLTTNVLPEVVVGLKDSHDDLVAATLQALAELIPFIGSSTVMGNTRKNIFIDTRPKEIQSMSSQVYAPTKTRHSSASIASSSKETKEKQRVSNKGRKPKGRTGGVSGYVKPDESTATESDSSFIHRHDNKPHPYLPLVNKYSPSASIDDVSEHQQHQNEDNEHNGGEEHWTEDREGDDDWEGFEQNTGDNDWGDWKEGDDGNDEEKKDGGSVEAEVHTSSPSTTTGLSSMKLDGTNSKSGIDENSSSESVGKSDGQSEGVANKGRSGGVAKSPMTLTSNSTTRVKTQLSTDSVRSTTSSGKSDEDALRKAMKGQLSEEDLKRLEEKAQWSKETDLFADMEPKINKTVRHSISNTSTGRQYSSSLTADEGSNSVTGSLSAGFSPVPVNDGSKDQESKNLKLEYEYNPSESEDTWGNEGWGDIDTES